MCSIYAERTTGGWKVTAKLGTTGSKAATINAILINGRPVPQTLVADGHVMVDGTVPTNVIATLDPGRVAPLR